MSVRPSSGDASARRSYPASLLQAAAALYGPHVAREVERRKASETHDKFRE